MTCDEISHPINGTYVLMILGVNQADTLNQPTMMESDQERSSQELKQGLWQRNISVKRPFYQNT